MSNFDQYNDVSSTITTMVAGEVLAFYANIDELETSANFGNWHLNLLFSDFRLAITDIGVLVKDQITVDGYRFYSEITVPPDITPSCYYLVIVDETDTVKYLSNSINASSITDNTLYIRYRNGKNMLNFNYEGLTDFYNRARIKLTQRAPSYPTTRIGYELIDGSFNPVRSLLGVNKEHVTEAYESDDHQAFNSATIQTFEIFEEGSFKEYRRGTNEYNVEWNGLNPLADGTITLEFKETYSSNDNV